MFTWEQSLRLNQVWKMIRRAIVSGNTTDVSAAYAAGINNTGTYASIGGVAMDEAAIMAALHSPHTPTPTTPNIAAISTVNTVARPAPFPTGVRCAFSDRILHSRMPLVLAPALLKQPCV